jgi:regulator of RNase E activity RraA
LTTVHESRQVASISGHVQTVLGADVSDDVLATLRGVGVSTLVQNLQRHGIQGTFLPGVIPRNMRRRFAGRAFTMRCLPPRGDVVKALAGDRQRSLHRRAFTTPGPGDVVVIDARGDQSAGVLGDVLATGLALRGAEALVSDGAVRDLPAMQEVDLPIYTRGIHAATFGQAHIPFDLNVPVQCAGVLILPGDILAGDEEGVVVIPQALAAQIATAGADQEVLDRFILTKLKEGATLDEAFPPNERLQAEFERWRAEERA